MDIPNLPGFIPGLVKAGQFMAIIAIAIHHAAQAAPTGASARIAAPSLLALTSGMVPGLLAAMLLPYEARVGGLFALILLVALAAAATWPRGRLGPGIAGFAGIALGLAAVPANGVLPDLLVPLAVNVLGSVLAVIGLWRLCLAAARGPFWAMIGLRIIAAWIAAIALMMLAFLLV